MVGRGQEESVYQILNYVTRIWFCGIREKEKLAPLVSKAGILT